MWREIICHFACYWLKPLTAAGIAGKRTFCAEIAVTARDTRSQVRICLPAIVSRIFKANLTGETVAETYPWFSGTRN